MPEIVYRGLVESDRLAALIADCHFSQKAWFLAELLPAQIIRSAKERKNLLRVTFFDEHLSFSSYTSGRVFEQDTELRWEKQSNRIRVVYIGPEERASVLRDYGLKAWEKLATLKKGDEPRYYYLFGERLRQEDLEQIGPAASPGDFAELRIPRLLRYPVAQNDQRYVRVAICEYCDAATGQVELFRFQTLETWE